MLKIFVFIGDYLWTPYITVEQYEKLQSLDHHLLEKNPKKPSGFRNGDIILNNPQFYPYICKKHNLTIYNISNLYILSEINENNMNSFHNEEIKELLGQLRLYLQSNGKIEDLLKITNEHLKYKNFLSYRLIDEVTKSMFG